jgi:ribonuclease HII
VFTNEKKLWEEGYKAVVGIDEAGRGPWAGPLIVGAVCLPKGIKKKQLATVKDSKKLSTVQREENYSLITHLCPAYATGSVSPEEIDQIGLSRSVRLAMTRALDGLPTSPDYLLLDANIMGKTQLTMALSDVEIETLKYQGTPSLSFIKGEDVSISIAAASIIAKVTRDRIMCELALQYPEYGFEEHKGYGTKMHQERLGKFGVSEMHRRSFEPVKSLLK